MNRTTYEKTFDAVLNKILIAYVDGNADELNEALRQYAQSRHEAESQGIMTHPMHNLLTDSLKTHIIPFSDSSDKLELLLNAFAELGREISVSKAGSNFKNAVLLAKSELKNTTWGYNAGSLILVLIQHCKEQRCPRTLFGILEAIKDAIDEQELNKNVMSALLTHVPHALISLNKTPVAVRERLSQLVLKLVDYIHLQDDALLIDGFRLKGLLSSEFSGIGVELFNRFPLENISIRDFIEIHKTYGLSYSEECAAERVAHFLDSGPDEVSLMVLARLKLYLGHCNGYDQFFETKSPKATWVRCVLEEAGAYQGTALMAFCTAVIDHLEGVRKDHREIIMREFHALPIWESLRAEVVGTHIEPRKALEIELDI